jgi:hypothetical protein
MSQPMMIVTKPADLAVIRVVVVGERMFIAGYVPGTWRAGDDEEPWQLYVLERGAVRVLVDRLPYPRGLVGNGAGGALCGTDDGLWSCTATEARQVDARPVVVMVRDERTLYWATKGEILRMPLAGGAIEVLHRFAERITTLALHRGALYWVGAAGELPPPTMLPGGFAILPLDDAPRALIVRPETGGRPTRMPFVNLMLTAIAVDSTGVFGVTRGGAPERFDGHVLRVPHGGAAWQTIATGRKLPAHLQPIPRGMVWSYEIPFGYVVEAFLDGDPVCLFERPNARLDDLIVDGDRLVFAEHRLERVPLGVLVTSDCSLLSVQLP